MRRIIQKRAKFDIMNLNVLKVCFLKHYLFNHHQLNSSMVL
uniref:Uncharacterized protein n=1 Tax=Arundo donax TaxID=35708 RepID=A0A0A9GH78_ARUDO